mmetsp:Transcript_26821/g.58319  ORF Transcript_26821/g.58319 Transcript_26821/m.58319 type:complete len:244 (-) Transcript_26821:184-915(-)
MLPIYAPELVPTDLALKLRPAFIASLFALLLLVVGKFSIRDWWGAVSLIFIVMMGLFVISGPYRVNASSALFYCVMAVIAGIFDVVSCILYFQHSKYKLFESKATGMALLAQVIFLVSPGVLFLSASVAYAMFADCSSELIPLQGVGGRMDYMNWEQGRDVNSAAAAAEQGAADSVGSTDAAAQGAQAATAATAGGTAAASGGPHNRPRVPAIAQTPLVSPPPAFVPFTGQGQRLSLSGQRDQ